MLRFPQIARRALVAGIALVFTAPLALRAQQANEDWRLSRDPNAEEPITRTKPKGGFKLFGEADFAITGMRQGGNSYWKVTSSTISDDRAGVGGSLDADFGGRVIGTRVAPTGYCCGYFELQLWATAGRGDWLKNRDRVPSLENVSGGGWSSRMHMARWIAEPRELSWSGKDGSVGSLYSGVTSEAGTGTCRDNSGRPNAFIGSGIPLLAGSDCPPTWAGGVFNAERPVPDSVYLNDFRANPATFTFDDWKIPSSRRANDKLYGSFQTYGVSVDYGKEQREFFGSVIPGQTGKPRNEGYPLGVEWNWNAWTYQVPTIADAMFYKATVVNKSAEVYGVGLDYDSLYLGFSVRPLMSGSQNPAVYSDPARGLVAMNMSNQNGKNCYGGNRGQDVAGGYTAGGTVPRTCLANTSTSRGPFGEFGGVIFFKTPIGDLRNKQFTDPTSPFFNPTHPLRGDTITFNQVSGCGFTCVTLNLNGVKARAQYGTLSNQEADVIAQTRAVSDWTNNDYFLMFRPADWPLRWSPATGAVGGYSRYVPPGNWDYNKDGKLDTLKVMTCDNVHPFQNGCGLPFSDTLPGGFANNIHNNVHAGVGPIKLKAGDSTSFVVAFLGSPDSTSWEASVSNLNRLYQSFWLSPEPPCMSNIVSAQTFGGNRQYNTSIRLFFDQSVNNCVDRFLLSQATVLKTSTLAKDIRLRVLNPDIVNNIRAIALPPGTPVVDTVPRDTLPATVAACRSSTTYSAALCQIRTGVAKGAVESLFIFKSCDNGATYTADAGVACTPSPSRDPAGGFPRYQWQSYARLARDSRGLFPVTYSDGGVTGGLTYTYVVTGKSWDAIWDVVDINAAGVLAPTKFSIRPGSANGLTANSANRNVSVVYLPVTRQAGSDSSLVTILPGLAADTIAQWSIATRLTKPVRGADITGRLILSDSSEVEVFDADITKPGITSTVVRLFQLGDTGSIVGTTNNRRRIAVRRDSFVVADTVTVDVGGFPTATTVTTGNSSRTFYRYRSGGRTGPQVTFVDGNRPIYLTDTLPPSNATADLPLVPAQTVPRSAWNGLSIGLDLSVARTLSRRAWSIAGIGNQSGNSAPSITWNPTGTGVQRDATFKGFSKYRITWGGPDWGPTPITFDRNNPANSNTQVAATLAARPSVGNSDVSATAATALSRALGRTITTDSLAAVKLPFSVKNVRLGNSDVTVALLKSQRPATILIGTGGDTVRVSVPADQWIAGDNLYFIERYNVVKEDTTAASPLTRRVALTAAGVPDSIAQTNVTWGPVILGCASVINCNPVTGIGGTGYTQTNANQVYEVTYFAHPQGIYSFPYTISAEKVAAKAADLTEKSLENVRVVPNPYVMFSQYEQSRGTKRLMFSGLPPTGTIRIYTASGQTVQEIKWVASDLDRNCSATVNTTQCAATGDLLWNMRTRENLEIGPGFYVFVISTDAGGKKIDKLGKFVVIH